jgi:superfamily I DNA/RNA helicase
LGAHFAWCAEWETDFRQLFAAYVEAKQRQNVLDYDDLLLYWAQIMMEGSIAEDLSNRFDHIFVDEYQDTNLLQSSILLSLKPTGSGLTVVGDDAQSIYSFRAATVRNILDFPSQFSPPAEIITLDRNYRSTQPILEAANAVIDLASERFTKNLWSERVSAERPSRRPHIGLSGSPRISAGQTAPIFSSACNEAGSVACSRRTRLVNCGLATSALSTERVRSAFCFRRRSIARWLLSRRPCCIIARRGCVIVPSDA